MKKIARLDYLDLQIYDELKTTVLIPEVDSDGISYESTIMVNDALAHELFALLEMPVHSSAWNNRVLYQGESREIFISTKRFQKSMQFKGSFFLRPDAIMKLQEVIIFLKERNIKFLVSRLDISYIITGEKTYAGLDRCDLKRLTHYTLKKKKKIAYYKAYNSRFSLVAYGKTAQIKKEKDSNYLKKFKEYYEITELPEDLINLELRILGTDSCAEITELLSEKIDLEKLKHIVATHASKRIKLTKKIINLLFKTSI